jgi:hypothetical protein
MGEKAIMSRTAITPDDPELGHLVPTDGRPVHVADGPDRVAVNPMPDYDADTPMRVKSLRLPAALLVATEAAGRTHPDGFSGVVREALTEWFERHQGAEAEVDDARRAVATLARLVDRLTAA